MSLNSTGQNISVYLPSIENVVDEDSVKLDAFVTKNKSNDCSLLQTRILFMTSMLEFSNSPQFQKLFHSLDREFSLNVRYSVDLSMNN